MGIRIEYPNGETEFLPTAAGASEKREDGHIIFCDSNGTPVKAIEDEEGLKWRPADKED
jgi:hypothetical protein